MCLCNQVHSAEADNISNMGKSTTRLAVLGASFLSKVNNMHLTTIVAYFLVIIHSS